MGNSIGSPFLGSYPEWMHNEALLNVFVIIQNCMIIIIKIRSPQFSFSFSTLDLGPLHNGCHAVSSPHYREYVATKSGHLAGKSVLRIKMPYL